jgi:aryl-alcohol dehydrogenase-like predicted oxidoreductase
MKAGKIRSFGLSNETPYGVTAFCRTAELLGLPKPCSVQNAYNLLVRNDFETGMMEACSPVNNNVALLAYSPLAGGALTGKYLDPKTVEPGARMRQFVGYMHRSVLVTCQELMMSLQVITTPPLL